MLMHSESNQGDEVKYQKRLFPACRSGVGKPLMSWGWSNSCSSGGGSGGGILAMMYGSDCRRLCSVWNVGALP